MKNPSATYHRTRTDWSSEIKTTRTPSDTGRGGIEQDSQGMPDGDANNRPRTVNVNGQDMNNWQDTNQLRSNNGQDMNRLRSNNEQDTDQLRTNTEREMRPLWPNDGQDMNQLWPNIENNLSNDVIEAPTTMEEVYRGSMKALLLRNVGNYVVATFLIGTQTTVSWEGILYDVGNDYLAIYQSGRDQYIVSDLYSLKYVEFYDTRRRELCDALLTEQDPTGNFQRQ